MKTASIRGNNINADNTKIPSVYRDSFSSNINLRSLEIGSICLSDPIPLGLHLWCMQMTS